MKKAVNDMKELISKSKSKKIYITEDQQKKLDFTSSRIQECLIMSGNEKVSSSTKYKPILIDIWKTMRPEQIRQTSTFNFKLTKEKGIDGFRWCSDINMSIRNKNTNNTLAEIVNMVKVNRMSLNITIKLQNGIIVYYKIDS